MAGCTEPRFADIDPGQPDASDVGETQFDADGSDAPDAADSDAADADAADADADAPDTAETDTAETDTAESDSAADPCDPDPCDQGECLPEGDSFECDCDEGFDGDLCETNTDDCVGVSCDNDGTCVDEVAGFRCDCVDGFSGDRCETNIDDCAEHECDNGGACIDLVLAYECDCPTGFDGDRCETNLDDCVEHTCVNGSCVDGIAEYSCDCELGWDGPDCSENPDDCEGDPCQNDGLCFDGLDEFVCRCVDGWDGPTCEIELDSCDSLPCENEATCTNLPGPDAFSCACPDGFYGETCSRECEQGRCVGPVTCDPGTGGARECTSCEEGFAGRDCGIDLRTCDSDPCYPTVACTEVEGEGIECGDCPVDFEGDGETCRAAVTWFETYGDPNDDAASSNMNVVVDESSDIYVVGVMGGDFSVGTLSFSVNRFGAYVAKFSSTGEFIWATPFSTNDGTNGENAPLDIAIHPISGDVILSGNSHGGQLFAGETYWGTPNLNGSATLYALDAETGAPRWVTIIEPTVVTRGVRLAITDEGDVVTAFQAGAPLASLPAVRGDTGYVAFVDYTTGEVLDGFGFGATTHDRNIPLAVATLDDGDVVVVGVYHTAAFQIGDTTLPFLANLNGYAARFSRSGTNRWAMAIATDSLEQIFDVDVGPSGAIYISGVHDGGTTIGEFELEFASSGTLLARLNPDSGVVEWATGHAPSTNSPYGLQRFLIDEREHIHFTTTTSTSVATRFGTNEVPVEVAGTGIRMSLVDGATGRLLRERVISIGGPAIHSENIAFIGTDEAVIAGNFAAAGTLLGVPFGSAARTGHDHYIMRVARLLPPDAD